MPGLHSEHILLSCVLVIALEYCLSLFSELKTEAPWLAGGFLLMFFSGVGQTFYIALFAGHLRGDLALTDSQFGGIFAAGTLASAALLALTGRVADVVPIRILGVVVLAGLAISCYLMSRVQEAWALLLLLFALRYFGQGMCTHTAMTAMGRWFNLKRGRAVAVAGLGRPFGEGTMPGLAVLGMSLIGWRQTWAAAAIVLLVIGIPVLYWLLRQERHPTRGPGKQSAISDIPDRHHWKRSEVLRYPLFYGLLPGVLAPPFIITAVFFSQVTIADEKSWPLAWFAAAFPVLAAAHITSSLVAGWLIDRIGARRIPVVYLLALGVALATLIMGDSRTTLVLAMAAVGVATGFAATISGALWAELFGTVHLGAIRSATTAIIVVSTAVSPGMVGVLLDTGVSMNRQMSVMAVYVLLAAGWMLFLIPKLEQTLHIGRVVPEAEHGHSG